MKKLIFISAFLLLIAAQTGYADVSFQPQSPTINVGDPLTVDVMISGITAPWLGAYDIHISYDPAILPLPAVLMDAFLIPSIIIVAISTGSVEVSETSLASVADLGNAQSGHDPFRLFELIFGSAPTPGISTLTFDSVNLADGNGDQLSPGNTSAGSVTVQGSTAVPEPSTMLLLGSGLLGLWGARRKFKK